MKAEREIAREGRRILRKLAQNAVLAPSADGHFRLGSIRIERALVEEFRKRDWLTGAPAQGFRLSDAGRGWLLRAENASGMAFAAQHQILAQRTITDEDGTERTVLVNDAESPLAWLRRRRHINAVQFEAGERLRRDFTLAQLTPRLGVDLSAPVHGGPASQAPLADTVIAAKQRFRRALQSAGPGLADLLFDVCCHLTRLEAAERTFGWPPRSAKVVLQIALDRLTEHYGIGVRGPERGKLRGWRLEAVS